MPHCQKEKHDHRSRSKKDKRERKESLAAKKKAARDAEEEDELEDARKLIGNNLALRDGFGEYEVGCEEEMECVAKFNMNKRSKKHLRMDIIKHQQKKEREEEERQKKQKEENYRLLQREKLRVLQSGEEEEEACDIVVVDKEYFVYICQCCNKKFNTTNQFKNHTMSKKHRDAAMLYEEAGVIVTDVVLVDNEEDCDSEGGEFEGEDCDLDEEELDEEVGETSDGEDDVNSEEEEEEEAENKIGSLFSALAAFSDSSSSSSESSEDENLEVEEDDNCAAISENLVDVVVAKDDEDDCNDDDLDLLEDIIYQNRLQDRFYPDDNGSDAAVAIEGKAALAPVAFDDDQYDPDNFNDDRLAAVQHRLQKRLAAKGIQPNQIQPGYRSSDAVSVGKTLLAEVMEASVETMQAKLALYKQHKTEHQLLGREFRFAKGNSKALASQYSYRIDPSDNARQRANVHHAGSHYHMAGARSTYYGRSKGLMARHSSQGSRLQASRMASQETARTHGKGMAKVGKTSKKSTQKRRGEAGGNKKSGGMGAASEM